MNANTKGAGSFPPPVPLDLTTVDGNAFMLIGAFRRAARRAGWSAADIERVQADATSGDYDHLLQVLIRHTTTEE